MKFFKGIYFLLHNLKKTFTDKNSRMLLFFTITILTTGTLVYHFIEKWSWLDSIYFSIITLTTIGYGDLAPQTVFGKIFTIFYVLSSLGIILAFIETISSRMIKEKMNNKK